MLKRVRFSKTENLSSGQEHVSKSVYLKINAFFIRCRFIGILSLNMQAKI